MCPTITRPSSDVNRTLSPTQNTGEVLWTTDSTNGSKNLGASSGYSKKCDGRIRNSSGPVTRGRPSSISRSRIWDIMSRAVCPDCRMETRISPRDCGAPANTLVHRDFDTRQRVPAGCSPRGSSNVTRTLTRSTLKIVDKVPIGSPGCLKRILSPILKYSTRGVSEWVYMGYGCDWSAELRIISRSWSIRSRNRPSGLHSWCNSDSDKSADRGLPLHAVHSRCDFLLPKGCHKNTLISWGVVLGCDRSNLSLRLSCCTQIKSLMSTLRQYPFDPAQRTIGFDT